MKAAGSRRLRLALTFVLSIAAGAPTAAQTTIAPPYEAPLLRLSEILGAIHYLRQLCGSAEGDLWRDQMQALIEAENPDFVGRLKLADSFNRGYDSYGSVYLSCTPSARLTIGRFMEEGALLAGEIVARYGEDG